MNAAAAAAAAEQRQRRRLWCHFPDPPRCCAQNYRKSVVGVQCYRCCAASRGAPSQPDVTRKAACVPCAVSEGACRGLCTTFGFCFFSGTDTKGRGFNFHWSLNKLREHQKSVGFQTKISLFFQNCSPLPVTPHIHRSRDGSLAIHRSLIDMLHTSPAARQPRLTHTSDYSQACSDELTGNETVWCECDRDE
jgi:hypothetical protein